MRTRSRSINPIASFSYKRNTQTGPITQQPFPPISLGSNYFETMTDDKFPVKDEKPCLHKWTRRSMGEGRFHSINPTYGSGWFNQPHYLTTVNQVTLGTGWDISKLTLAKIPLALRQDALISLLPKVNDGLSLINTILELKDLRRMFSVQTLNKQLVKRGLPKRRRKRDATTADIAGDYLNYNFGWAPFVGDLTASLGALSGMSQRLKYLEKHANRVLRRSVSFDLYDYVVPTSVVNWEDCKLGFWCKSTRFNSFSVPPRYSATLVYSYKIPNGVSSIFQKLRGYLDAFGVRPDLSVIWNAVPFSFVVDWFVDVGGFLRQFTPNDLGMEISVHDYSQSVKYVRSTQTEFTTHWTKFGPEKGSLEFAGSIDEGYYERNRDIPSMFSLSTGQFDMMKASLGGALVVSSRHR